MQIRLLSVLVIGLLSGILSAQTLTHGPIVGGVTDTSAVFVLRVDTAALVQVEVSVAQGFGNSVFSNTVNTENDSDNFGKVQVTGLQPATRYYYRAVINESPVIEDIDRYFHTFPEVGTATQFEFHFGSGQQNGPDPESGFGFIFPKMAADKPDFVLHQGDWVYPDTTDSESGMPGNYFSLDYNNVISSYHTRYDPEFPMRELLAVAPIDYTYDDHDMIDNNADGVSFPWSGIANSIRGYVHMFPGYPLPDSSKGVYHKFTYGNTDIFMVDNRSQRTPNLANYDIEGDFVYFNPKPGHTILGSDQMDWLLTELSNSEATWKFISSGTPFNSGWRVTIDLAVAMQGIIPGLEVPEEGVITPTEIAVELGDKWAGFPDDIIKLIKHIRENNIENVIFLSGDTHTCGIDDGANSIIPELMAGGLDRTNGQLIPLFEEFGIFIWNSGGHTAGLPPEEYSNAYGRVTVFGDDSVALEAVSESGRILGRHVVEPGFIPRSVGTVVAPLFLDYGEVVQSDIGELGFIIVSTSMDTLKVNSITKAPGADFGFIIDPESKPTPFDIPPGQSELIGVGFLSLAAIGDTSRATILVETNDPIRPLISIPLQAITVAASAIEAEEKTPSVFALFQNYPNPFNPVTTIKFALPKTEKVRIELFNITGQKVQTILESKMPAGIHDVKFNAADLASGIYFYQIEAGAYKQVRKMVLLK